MPAHHIDFKHVRQNGDFAKVLAHYEIAMQKDGPRDGQFKCLCPFHDDEKPSLKINTERNIYHCFVCDAGGNIIEFVMEMEDETIRDAAKCIAELSGIETAPQRRERVRQKEKPKAERSRTRSRKATKPEKDDPESKQDDPEPEQPGDQKKPAGTGEQEQPPRTDEKSQETNTEEPDGLPYNRPLTFQLKNLVTDHPFMIERGLTPQMVETFGLGVATRGIMKDRLVFPIHNRYGELVAYCGRYLGNEIPENEPKYKQPSNFRKELELFNWHRVKDAGEGVPLIIVESFFSVVKLHAMGKRCVSPMGRSLSKAQIVLLKEGGVNEVILLFDGDDPGRAAVATEGRKLLAEGLKVSAPVVQDDFKPHRGEVEELIRLLQ